MKDETLKGTKLGWIPEDWEVINIEDSQINIIDGDRGKNYPKQDEFLEKGFCLFLNASNVTKAGFNFDSCQFISKEKDHSLRKGKLKRNDLVLTTRGTVGNLAFFDSSVPFEIMRINSGMVILRNENPHISNRFAYIIFGSDLLQKQIKRIAFGSAQPQLTVGTIRKLTIPLPPLPEQRKIAEVLSTWDKAIALTEQLIAAKKQRKKALMQQLLTGRRRFREFEGNAWREMLLGKVAELTAGGTPSTKVEDYWGGKIRWMKSGEVHLRRIYDVEGRITQAGLDNSSAKLIPKDSVLIALAGQGKTRGTVAINKTELSTNQSVVAIVPNPDLLYYEYLFYNLDARYDELRRLSSGEGGRGGLNLGLLKGVKVVTPSVKEQRKIAAVLYACDREIDLLILKLAALQRQKKGLMQQLLTARTRVKV